MEGHHCLPTKSIRNPHIPRKLQTEDCGLLKFVERTLWLVAKFLWQTILLRSFEKIKCSASQQPSNPALATRELTWTSSKMSAKSFHH